MSGDLLGFAKYSSSAYAVIIAVTVAFDVVVAVADSFRMRGDHESYKTL